MTKQDYSVKVRFEVNSFHPNLDHFPESSSLVMEFEAANLTIHGWMNQVRELLAAQGFDSKLISEYCGD
jgi:hypothetical protein